MKLILRMKIGKAGVPLAAALALTGCANLSGLDANDKFSCKAPEGILCESMSGIYANAMANNLPAQQRKRRNSDQTGSEAQQPAAGVLTKPIYSGTPIRSAPQVLRVWFAPWEDSDGNLHDQGYVYLQVDNGQWLVEHNRRRIQDAYRPVRPPTASAAAASAASPRTTEGASAMGDAAKSVTQNSTDMLNSLLKPGVPASPTQGGEAQ